MLLEQARHQGGTLAERIAANREAIDALREGTARLRARTGPLRERTVAHPPSAVARSAAPAATRHPPSRIHSASLRLERARASSRARSGIAVYSPEGLC